MDELDPHDQLVSIVLFSCIDIVPKASSFDERPPLFAGGWQNTLSLISHHPTLRMTQITTSSGPLHALQTCTWSLSKLAKRFFLPWPFARSMERTTAVTDMHMDREEVDHVHAGEFYTIRSKETMYFRL